MTYNAAKDSYDSWLVGIEALYKKHAREMTPYRTAHFKLMWVKLYPTVEIAEEFCISESTVRKRAARLGLKRRKSLIVSEARALEIRKRWDADESLRSIAEQVGLSIGGVAYVAKRLGLKPRRVTNLPRVNPVSVDEKWATLLGDQRYDDPYPRGMTR